jgi:hypothetical protein
MTSPSEPFCNGPATSVCVDVAMAGFAAENSCGFGLLAGVRFSVTVGLALVCWYVAVLI